MSASGREGSSDKGGGVAPLAPTMPPSLCQSLLSQDGGANRGAVVFVPFFGVPACTLTSVSRLAKMGHARVVPFVTEVLPDLKGYKLNVFAPLSDFPSERVAAD